MRRSAGTTFAGTSDLMDAVWTYGDLGAACLDPFRRRKGSFGEGAKKKEDVQRGLQQQTRTLPFSPTHTRSNK